MIFLGILIGLILNLSIGKDRHPLWFYVYVWVVVKILGEEK